MSAARGTRGSLTFWKMSGAGNDFIVFPLAPEELPGDPAEFVRQVCARGTSVGADGVLFVTPAKPVESGDPGVPVADVDLVHYNSDGGKSAFCGNGSRCAARFASLRGFAGSKLLLRTGAGVLRAEILEERVRIEVPPCSSPVAMRLEAQGTAYDGWLVVAGVPHFVLSVEDVARVDVSSLGGALRAHPALGAAGANIDFVAPGRGGKVMLRTFERGVEGETLACGSGAIAVAMVLALDGRQSPITLTPRSGIDLTVEFDRIAERPGRLRLTGEARVVFEGRLCPEEFDPGEGGA